MLRGGGVISCISSLISSCGSVCRMLALYADRFLNVGHCAADIGMTCNFDISQSLTFAGSPR